MDCLDLYYDVEGNYMFDDEGRPVLDIYHLIPPTEYLAFIITKQTRCFINHELQLVIYMHMWYGDTDEAYLMLDYAENVYLYGKGV